MPLECEGPDVATAAESTDNGTMYGSSISDLLRILRSVASEGLMYAEDPHNRVRYERLMAAATEQYADLMQSEESQIRSLIAQEIGIVTPKLGVDIVLHRCGLRELLILKRADDHLWCLPGGWVEVGERMAHTIARECKEETGLVPFLRGIVAVTEKGPSVGPSVVHQANVLFAAEPLASDVLITLSHEHVEHQWITTTEGIEWHAGHNQLAQLAFNAMDRDQLGNVPLPKQIQ